MKGTMRAVCVLGALAAAGCSGEIGGGGDDGGDDAPDAGGDPTPDAGDEPAACDRAVMVPAAGRPTELMPAGELAAVAALMPCVTAGPLRDVLESTDTMWYGKTHIIPGYQDSFGDNVQLPVGMRPNTIDNQLIDLAVPGGHAQIFVEKGTFHFPFGRPTGVVDEQTVVNFWHVPRDGAALLPVVWWRRTPSSYTRRYEWMFPAGTVFGELMFIVKPNGDRIAFEIRTRTRTPDGWTVDTFRPFRTAAEFADALARKRMERPEWQSSSEIDALIAHLGDTSTVEAASATASHFSSAFPSLPGGIDRLPGLSDNSIIDALLAETPFRSARDAIWKDSGARHTYAASTDAAYSIVPRDFNAGLFPIDDETCSRCHRDAGRPFRDWYSNIIAYGELWGMDETFTWHPFRTANFVDSDGDVVNFNYDNRQLRTDLTDPGLLVEYSPSSHPASIYKQIVRDWTNFVY
jgi:hypothetical protein